MNYCCCCDAPSTEETLYQCDSNGCRVSDKLYCKSCGDMVHNKMNHNLVNNSQHQSDHDCKNEEKKLEQYSSPKQNESNIAEVHSSNINRQEFLTKAIGISMGGGAILGNLGALGELAKVGFPAVMATASIIPHAAAVAMFATCAYSAISTCKSKKKSETVDPRVEAEEIALVMFNFDENDLENNQRFNAQTINNRYKRMAKYYHPDKKHGDYATFIRLDVSRRILLSMFDPKQYEFPSEDAFILCCSDDTLSMRNRKAIEYPMQTNCTNHNQYQHEQGQRSWFSVGRLFK